MPKVPQFSSEDEDFRRMAAAEKALADWKELNEQIRAEEVAPKPDSGKEPDVKPGKSSDRAIQALSGKLHPPIAKITRAPKPPPPLRGGMPRRSPQRFRMPPSYPYPDGYPMTARAKVMLAMLVAVKPEMTAEKGVLHAVEAFLAGAREPGVSGAWSVDRIAREALEFFLHVVSYQEGIRIEDLEQQMHALDVYRQVLRDVATMQLTATPSSDVPSATKAPERSEPARQTAPAEVPSISETPEEKSARRLAVVAPLLRSRGWKKSDWAAKAGVSTTVVYRYCNGQTDPDPENRSTMARALGLKEAIELPV